MPTKAKDNSYSHRFLILFICCFSLLMVSLDVTIVNVALPSIQRDLKTSISGAQWTIDAYALVLASLLLLSGSTADRIGRRRTFQLGLVIFALGSLLCSLSPSIGWLIFFRGLQAVGGSMLNPVALSIVNNVFTEPKERAKAIGIWGGTVGISMAIGPIGGGALVSGVSWRSIFWINIPVAIAALILTTKFVPESKAAKARRFDPVGQLSVIGFLGLLIYGIIEAPTKGWTSPLIISCFVASLALLVGLITYESRRFQPLLELKFFKSAPFSGATVIAIGAFIALGGFLFLNTLYLQDVLGFSAIKAGLHLIPMAVAMLIFGPVAGRVVAARGSRLPLTIGGTAFTVVAAVFALSGSDLSMTKLLIGYGILGAGLGFINAAITNAALSGMPRSQSGVAAATTSTSRQVGQSLGVAIIGSILASNASIIHKGSAFSSDWKICWLVLTGVGVVILLATNITSGKWGLKTAEKFRKEIQAEEAEFSASIA